MPTSLEDNHFNQVSQLRVFNTIYRCSVASLRILQRHDKASLWDSHSTHILLSTLKTAGLWAVTQSHPGTGREE